MTVSRTRDDAAAIIVDAVDAIVQSCEEQHRPLEVDPARAELFELFVQAYQGGMLSEASDTDLTADGLCQQLSARWGLKSAAQDSVRRQEPLPAEQLARMRSLWSVMRMWMEWTYAWERWSDFHPGESTEGTDS